MEAKTRIPQDPPRALPLDPQDPPEPGARAISQAAGPSARHWEIKGTLLEVAQGALSEATFWPAALGALRRLFAATDAVLWVPHEGRWEARHRDPAEGPAPCLSAALLDAAKAARHPQTAATTKGGDVRLSLLGALPGGSGPGGVVQLVLGSRAMQPASVADVELALGQLALGLASVRRFEALAYHADHDPLTGLVNRRALGVFLDREFRLAKRHGTPMSLLLVDVDHFKAYNDTYGHPAGDALLQALAGALGHAVRSTDVVARFGGEEFLIVLPHTAAPGAQLAAEKVLAAVRALSAHPDQALRRVTASVGVATCDGRVCSADALIEAADQAMYRAKRGGRDRACVA